MSTPQGNASGAMLHQQYMQSLFAAAADGLLHSPDSLLQPQRAAPNLLDAVVGGGAAAAVPNAAEAPAGRQPPPLQVPAVPASTPRITQVRNETKHFCSFTLNTDSAGGRCAALSACSAVLLS